MSNVSFDALSSAINNGTPYIGLAAGVVTRMSAIALLLPGLGERAVPMRVRLAAVLGLTFVMTPLIVDGGAATPQTPAAFVLLISAEAVNGLVIGFAIRMLIIVLQIAGTITAQHLSLSQIFGASLGQDLESPFATILIMGGLAIAMANDFLFHLVGVIFGTFQVLAFGVFPSGEEIGDWSARAMAGVFLAALALAAPFVILGFVYSLALAAASRAMPQLMAAFVGAPAITFAGLVLFAGAAIIVLSRWFDMFDGHLGDLFGAFP